MENKTDYQYIEHIIKRQKRAEDKMLTEFAKGVYTLEKPLVIQNVYEICPLSAMILFRTEDLQAVTVTIKGKTPAADIIHTFAVAKEHILPIYGLYADYENRVEIALATGEKNVITITTALLPEKVPQAESIKCEDNYLEGKLMFLTPSMRAVPASYDCDGEVRWYADENLVFAMKRLENGHILIGTERLVKMPYFTTGLYEMNMGGKIFAEYRLDGGYHHDQWEMEDGNILTLSFDFYSGTVEDMCVLLDRETGEVLKRWNYKDILPQYPVAGSGSQDAHDWFHNNSVWYDKKTNTLTLSGRHQDAVINIDYETGKLNWILGDPEGWPAEMVEKYFFTPIGDDFEWQYEQHACSVLADGDILLFDNGHYRSKNKEKYVKNSENYSRGVRYRINTEDMTVCQIWQYGKERGSEFFSPYISNAEYYGEGHYLVHSGGIGYENGKICDGFAVTRAMSPKHRDKVYTFKSITCEIKDGQLVYELVTPANFYRAEKMSIYADDEVFEPGEGKILGELVMTKRTRMKMTGTEMGAIPESYGAKIVEEDDRLTFSATFEAGEMAQLQLHGAEGILRYPIDTIAKTFQAMCVGTFQKADPRSVDVFINKRDLNGKYHLKLAVEDKIYDSGIMINC